MALNPIGMLRRDERLAFMAQPATIGLVAGLPLAFRSLHFAIAVFPRRFTAVAAALGQTGLQLLQEVSLLRQLLGKLLHLAANIMEQVQNCRLTSFKGCTDFVIAR